jgi:hypothetical protein
MSTRIIGIDPGYDRLGIAIIEGPVGREQLLYSTCVTTSKKQTFPERLAQLGKTVEQLLKEYRPNVLAIEKLFFTKNQLTAIENYLKIPYLYTNDKSWMIKAYLRVARIFENKEDWANAGTTYKKILELNTDEAKYAQERLDWISANTADHE